MLKLMMRKDARNEKNVKKENQDELNYVLDVLEADEADLDQYRGLDDTLT